MSHRRATVGIAIGATTLRVLLSNTERVLGSHEMNFGNKGELSSTLYSALDELLRPFGNTRPRVAAAVLGPHLAQLRPIPHSSATTSRKLMQAQIDKNIGQYFVLSDSTLAIALSVQKNGQAWAVGFDRVALEHVCEACHRCRLTLLAAGPMALALRAAVSQPHIAWIDDGWVSHITYESSGELNSLRRLPVGDDAIDPPLAMTPALATMGSNAWHFADAFGATSFAMKRRAHPLVLDAAMLPQAKTWGRARTGTAAGVASMALGAALMSPGFAARRDAAHSREHLRISASQTTAAAIAYRDAAAAARLATAITQASNARRSMTFTIDLLTRAIPDTAFLTDLRLSDAEGTLIVVAPRAAAVVAALATVRQIEHPALVGAVVPQTINDVVLERATIRFRWAIPRP